MNPTEQRRCSRVFSWLGWLSVSGALLSSYLVVAHTLGLAGSRSPSICGVGDWLNCDAVNSSSYSQLFGVPISLFGVLFYGATAVFAFLGKRREKARPFAATVLRGFSATALAFSLYLGFVSIARLHAVCLFCFSLYLLNIGMVWLSFRLPVRHLGLWQAGRLAAAKLREERKLRYATGLVVVLVGALLFSFQQVGQSLLERSTRDLGLSLRTGASAVGAIKGQAFGPEQPLLSVFIFSDFECPLCAKAVPTVDELIERYHDRVQFVFKHFPLDPSCNPVIEGRGHPNSCNAARAAVCAAQRDQFAQFHRDLFDRGTDSQSLRAAALRSGVDPDWLSRCAQSLQTEQLLAQEVREALALGVQGTPSFLVGDRLFHGLQDKDLLIQNIERVLGGQKGVANVD